MNFDFCRQFLTFLRRQAEKVQSEWNHVSQKPVLCNGENLLKIISSLESKLEKYHDRCKNKITAVKELDDKVKQFHQLRKQHYPKLKEIFDLRKTVEMAYRNMQDGKHEITIEQTEKWLEEFEKQKLELADIENDGGKELVDEIVERLGTLNQMDCIRLLNFLADYRTKLENAKIGELKEIVSNEIKPALVKQENLNKDMSKIERLFDEIVNNIGTFD